MAACVVRNVAQSCALVAWRSWSGGVIARPHQRRRPIGLRLCSYVALALIAVVVASPGHASISLTSTLLYPAGPRSAVVVFEASSTHAAVWFVYEDERARVTRQRVVAITPQRRDASGNGTIIHPYELIARAVEDAGSLGGVTAAVAARRWRVSETGLGLPEPVLEFAVWGESASVRTAADAMESWASAEGKPGDFWAAGRAAATLFRQSAERAKLGVPIRSDGYTLPTPAVAASQTGLGWLWEFMLQHEGGGELAGCTVGNLRDKSGVDAAARSMLDQYVSLAERMPLELLLTLVSDLDPTARARRWDFLIRMGRLAQSALGPGSEYAELLALGRVDPAQLPIARCMGARAARGIVDPAHLVIERSIAYGQIDSLIAANASSYPDERAPRFFDAARVVTRLPGVGMIDVADDYGLEGDSLGIRLVELWEERGECLPDGGSILPDREGRALLREINAKLLAFNAPRVKRLLDAPGVLFDPTMTAAAVGPPVPVSDAITFDLRMVLAEQTEIERLLRARTPLARAADAALTRSELALRCFATDRLISSVTSVAVPAPRHVDRLAAVDELLDSLNIDDSERRFSSYAWRVAIGSAHVFALHADHYGDGWKEAYLAYMRAQLDLERRHARLDGGLSPALDARLRAAVTATPSSSSDDALGIALAAYFEPNGREFYDCPTAIGPAEPDLSTLRTEGPLLPAAARLANLTVDGRSPLALAYELLGDGSGALDSAIGLREDMQPALVCQGIRSKRAALDCALTTPSSSMCAAAPVALATGSDLALILDESSALRAEIVHLGPHLPLALEGVVAGRIDADLEVLGNIAQRAHSGASDYRRNLAIAGMLGDARASDLAALGLVGEAAEPATWRAWFESALPEGETDAELVPRNATGEEIQKRTAAYLREHGFAARVERVRDTASLLDRAIAPILGRYKLSASTMPKPRFGVGAGGAERASAAAVAQAEASESATPASLRRLPGVLAPGERGLGLEIEPLPVQGGTARRYRAELVYGRENGVSHGTACVTDGPKKDASCQKALSEEALAPTGLTRIPLGLTITGLVFGEGGS